MEDFESPIIYWNVALEYVEFIALNNLPLTPISQIFVHNPVLHTLSYAFERSKNASVIGFLLFCLIAEYSAKIASTFPHPFMDPFWHGMVLSFFY